MKKLVSRFMAVLMAMTMILSMSMTAFAAEASKGTLTVNNTVAGKTLDLYQIFTATKNGDISCSIPYSGKINLRAYHLSAACCSGFPHIQLHSHRSRRDCSEKYILTEFIRNFQSTVSETQRKCRFFFSQRRQIL